MIPQGEKKIHQHTGVKALGNLCWVTPTWISSALSHAQTYFSQLHFGNFTDLSFKDMQHKCKRQVFWSVSGFIMHWCDFKVINASRQFQCICPTVWYFWRVLSVCQVTEGSAIPWSRTWLYTLTCPYSGFPRNWVHVWGSGLPVQLIKGDYLLNNSSPRLNMNPWRASNSLPKDKLQLLGNPRLIILHIKCSTSVLGILLQNEKASKLDSKAE